MFHYDNFDYSRSKYLYGYDFFETKHLRKDGRSIDIEASVNFLIEEQPKLFCFMLNITERKLAEKALLESKEHLEIHVKERTAESFFNCWEYKLVTCLGSTIPAF